jgi:hypothetical protein
MNTLLAAFLNAAIVSALIALAVWIVLRLARRQPSFAVATGAFPAELASGKHIRFSGYIKTDAVIHGRAGLWWRVDNSEMRAIAADLMDGGATGTSDWTRYAIDLDVPREAANINFGAMFSGEGTAWFDSLQVEIDGVPYHDESFDFDFESQYPRGFFTGGNGYGVQLDSTVAYAGKQSLRMKYGAASVVYSNPLLSPEGAVVELSAPDARGKRLRFSGYIKTKDVTGYADLVCSIAGQRYVSAVRGLAVKAEGTTDWARYELTVDVPRNANRIELDALINGTGTAWFDSLEVEIDGVPYRGPGMDLDFETDLPHTGFHYYGDKYRLVIDNDVFRTGKQSLRLEKPR